MLASAGSASRYERDAREMYGRCMGDTWEGARLGGVRVEVEDEKMLKDTTLSSVVATSVENSDELHTAFGAGTILYGKFTNVTIAAGGLVAVHKI